MSLIDTRLAPTLRASYLTEVRQWLPAFLAGASVERTQPLDDVSELFGLDPAALRRVLAVHIVRHSTTQELVDALPKGVRSPATSSERPREFTRVLTGGIDWAATYRARATSSPLEVGFVTRSATRVFDLPENQILKWVLRELDKHLTLALPMSQSTGEDGWRNALWLAERRVRSAGRVAWLREVPTSASPRRHASALHRSRRAFYRGPVRECAEFLMRYEDPTPAEVANLLVDRWFEPARDWALFEFVVLLRIHRRLATLGQRVRLRGLGPGGSGAFAAYHLTSGATVRLWYQRWPDKAGASELLDATRYYGIPTQGSRPDIVVEFVGESQHDAVLLELKATQSSDYLASGFLQLLGYLRDRPALFTQRPSGWLVSPHSGSPTAKEPDGRDLWFVSADHVADAVFDWVAERS